MDTRRLFSLSRSCQLQGEEQAAGGCPVSFQFIEVLPTADRPQGIGKKTGFTGRTLVLPVIWHVPDVFVWHVPDQRRFDRVKWSANQDHVRHRRCIVTTVRSDFRLGGRF